MASLLAGLGTVDDSHMVTDLSRRPQSRRVPRLTTHECAQDLLTHVCACDENCFDKIRRVSRAAPTMSSVRVSLAEAGHRKSSSMLFQMLKPQRIRKSCTNNKFRINFCIRGVTVCKTSWFWYHDLDEGDARVKRVLASIRRGDNNWLSAGAASGSGSGRKSIAGQLAQVWMREHVTNYSEQIPNRCLFRVEPLEIMELHERYIGEQQLLKALYIHSTIYIYIHIDMYT